MSLKRAVLIALGAVYCGWLCFGVYGERGSGNIYLFVKHRPSFHFVFYDPSRDSETDTRPLSDSEKRALSAYDEFVSDGEAGPPGVKLGEHWLPILGNGFLILGLCIFFRRVLDGR